MFKLSSKPISPKPFDQPGSGGFVTFEGKVRDTHRGRQVLALEYEAYEALAVDEGEELLAEAVRRFKLTYAKAVHRTGKLEIGETAVWITVAAPHRHEAFAACEFVIDELKKRVPIWKKEHYADGDSGWIGCDDSGKAEGHNPSGVMEEDRPVWEVASMQAAILALGEFVTVDLREDAGFSGQGESGVKPWKHLPLSTFEADESLVEGHPVLFVCENGERSGKLVERLRAQGRTDVFVLAGGVRGMTEKV